MREASIVLLGDKVIDVSLGSGASVEFNFDKIWQYREYSNNLKFYHVHPAGFLGYSQTDLNCMKGFRVAFGHPVYFSVITFGGNGFEQISFVLDGDNVNVVENDEPHLEYVQTLKSLSYGVDYNNTKMPKEETMAEEKKEFNLENMGITDDRGNFSHLKLQEKWLVLIKEFNLINEKLDYLYDKIQAKSEEATQEKREG